MKINAATFWCYAVLLVVTVTTTSFSSVHATDNNIPVNLRVHAKLLTPKTVGTLLNYSPILRPVILSAILSIPPSFAQEVGTDATKAATLSSDAVGGLLGASPILRPVLFSVLLGSSTTKTQL